MGPGCRVQGLGQLGWSLGFRFRAQACIFPVKSGAGAAQAFLRTRTIKSYRSCWKKEILPGKAEEATAENPRTAFLKPALHAAGERNLASPYALDGPPTEQR